MKENQKKTIRKEILQKRLRLSPGEVAAKSRAIAEQVFDLPAFAAAKTIMAYVPFRNEVDTSPIIERALSTGKRVVVPISELSTMRLIPSEIWDYPGDLTEGTYGILEPRPDCVRPRDPNEIDLVLVPGVAYDFCGNRLGYGAGFYDRFLDSLPQAKSVALAFSLQVLDDAYPEPHDHPVQFLVTEEQVIDCRQESQHRQARKP